MKIHKNSLDKNIQKQFNYDKEGFANVDFYIMKDESKGEMYQNDRLIVETTRPFIVSQTSLYLEYSISIKFNTKYYYHVLKFFFK